MSVFPGNHFSMSKDNKYLLVHNYDDTDFVASLSVHTFNSSSSLNLVEEIDPRVLYVSDISISPNNQWVAIDEYIFKGLEEGALA